MPRDSRGVRYSRPGRGSLWQQGAAITRHVSLVAFTSQDGPESISQLGVIVEAEHGVSLRHGSRQLAAVALCQAPDGHYGLISAA